MIELVSSPFSPNFDEFVSAVRVSCLICSPYITLEPVNRFVQSVRERGLANVVKVHVVTDLTSANIVRGASDIKALIHLTENLPHVRIVYTPRIHAKVYLANEDYALIGSANFTTGGAWRNLEYGVCLRDKPAIEQIRADIMAYSNLGGDVFLANLLELQPRIAEIKEAIHVEQKTLNQKLRRLSVELEQQTQEQLIRIRVQGRTFHAILCDTILYLLRQRPMTTQEIHAAVQEMRTDLCDDAVDRVIDGKRFGKLWKRSVRTSQVTLTRKHLIHQEEGSKRWSLTIR